MVIRLYQHINHKLLLSWLCFIIFATLKLNKKPDVINYNMGYVLYYVVNSMTIAVQETSHCYYYMILFTIWTILVAPLGLSFLFFCTLKWRHLPSIVICYQQHYLFCLSFVHSLNYLTTRWACFNTLVCHALYPIENITTLLWSYWIMEFDPSRSDLDWG